MLQRSLLLFENSDIDSILELHLNGRSYFHPYEPPTQDGDILDPWLPDVFIDLFVIFNRP